jgi:hypothetical protein
MREDFAVPWILGREAAKMKDDLKSIEYSDFPCRN